MANVILAKVCMAIVLWQMKLSHIVRIANPWKYQGLLASDWTSET